MQNYKLKIFLQVFLPWTQNVNSTYIRRSEDVQESSERFTYVQFTSCVQRVGFMKQIELPERYLVAHVSRCEMLQGPKRFMSNEPFLYQVKIVVYCLLTLPLPIPEEEKN